MTQSWDHISEGKFSGAISGVTHPQCTLCNVSTILVNRISPLYSMAIVGHVRSSLHVTIFISIDFLVRACLIPCLITYAYNSSSGVCTILNLFLHTICSHCIIYLVTITFNAGLIIVHSEMVHVLQWHHLIYWWVGFIVWLCCYADWWNVDLVQIFKPVT